MNEANSSVMLDKWRVFRFGSNGSSVAQSCSRTGNTSRGMWRSPHRSSSVRILPAYFRKRASSSAVGSRLKDFRIKKSREGKTHVIGTLTMFRPSFQTSLGKDMSSGGSRLCVSHNESNTGSSKLLQQHARATEAAHPFDATSSWAIRLTISSTYRQGCIESGRGVEPDVGDVEEFYDLRLMSTFSGCGCTGWSNRGYRRGPER